MIAAKYSRNNPVPGEVKLEWRERQTVPSPIPSAAWDIMRGHGLRSNESENGTITYSVILPLADAKRILQIVREKGTQ